MVNASKGYQYGPSSIQPETLALVPAAAHRVLDLGGGTGEFTAAVMERCGAGFGAVVDVSEDAIRDRNERIDVAVVFDIEQEGRLEAFMTEHAPFDLVLCLDVLEHLVDPWALVERVHRCLPENGYILASIPNVQNYRIVLRALTGTWGYRESGLFDRTHLRFFSRRSAQAMMTGTGMRLVAAGRAFGPAPRDRLMSRLSLGALNPWVTMQNLVLVQKTGDAIRSPGFFGRDIPDS